MPKTSKSAGWSLGVLTRRKPRRATTPEAEPTRRTGVAFGFGHPVTTKRERTMNRTTTVRLGAAAATLTLAALLVGCGASGGDAADADKTTTTASADKTTTTAAETTTTAAEEETTTTDGSDTGRGRRHRDIGARHARRRRSLRLHGGPRDGHGGRPRGRGDPLGLRSSSSAVRPPWMPPTKTAPSPTTRTSSRTTYYIRNNNTTIRRLAVVPDAQVISPRRRFARAGGVEHQRGVGRPVPVQDQRGQRGTSPPSPASKVCSSPDGDTHR